MMMIMITTFNIQLIACAMVETLEPPAGKTIKEAISLPLGGRILFDSGQISSFLPQINRTPLKFDCGLLYDHTLSQRIFCKKKKNDRVTEGPEFLQRDVQLPLSNVRFYL